MDNNHFYGVLFAIAFFAAMLLVGWLIRRMELRNPKPLTRTQRRNLELMSQDMKATRDAGDQ